MMTVTETAEDVEIRRMLSGDERDVAEAFDRLNRTFRDQILSDARLRFRGMNAEDAADAWQDTLKALLEALREGRLGLVRNLRPWLWTVFRRRTYDLMDRGRKRRLAWEGAKEQLQGTSVGALVDGLGPEDRARLLAQIRHGVESLPPRQRLVLETFIDEYPLLVNREALRRRVSERTGREVSGAAIGRAFGRARRKIAGLLKRKTR